MLNRAALLVRYKQPFIDWINGVDPNPASHVVTLDEINEEERTVYLLEGVEDEAGLEVWLGVNGVILFEEELEGWYTDPTLWPRDRSLKTLKDWCAFELHTVVLDTGSTPIEDDDD